jgi:hypothetical protein
MPFQGAAGDGDCVRRPRDLTARRETTYRFISPGTMRLESEMCWDQSDGEGKEMP